MNVYEYAGVRVTEITKEEAKAYWKKNKFKADDRITGEDTIYKLTKGKTEAVFFIPKPAKPVVKTVPTPAPSAIPKV